MKIFQTPGRGAILLCQYEGTHQIVMAFSQPVVGCLLKKGLQKRVTGNPGLSLATPLPLYASSTIR